MELNLKNAEDLKKLEGWVIKGVAFQAAEQTDPEIVLRLEHLAAAHPVKLTIRATVTFGRSGNIALVNAALYMKTEDVQG